MYIKSVINISNLSPTHFVANIGHQDDVGNIDLTPDACPSVTFSLSRWQWCWWHRYVGDFFRYVGDFLNALKYIGHQNPESVTITINIDVTV